MSHDRTGDLESLEKIVWGWCSPHPNTGGPGGRESASARRGRPGREHMLPSRRLLPGGGPR